MLTSKVTQETLDDLYQNKYSNKYDEILDESIDELDINQFIALRTPSKASAIVRYLGGDEFKLVNPKLSIDNSIKPKDADQLALIDLLLDDEIKIVTATGPAGAGKSFLALAFAATRAILDKKMNVICTKPTETVGNSKFFGAVPGSNDDKYSIFLESFDLTMKKIFPDSVQYNLMKDQKKISFKPIEFCRGDSRENTILICDESQNLGWHQVKTLVSRFGENCKVILLGDLKQKDIRANEQSGFEKMFKSLTFRDSVITGHVNLINDYRGPISRLISEIDKEI